MFPVLCMSGAIVLWFCGGGEDESQESSCSYVEAARLTSPHHWWTDRPSAEWLLRELVEMETINTFWHSFIVSIYIRDVPFCIVYSDFMLEKNCIVIYRVNGNIVDTMTTTLLDTAATWVAESENIIAAGFTAGNLVQKRGSDFISEEVVWVQKIRCTINNINLWVWAIKR